jgi:hypothetical protein
MSLMGWTTIDWGLEGGAAEARKEPLAVAAAFLLSVDASVGVGSLLPHLASGVQPLERVAAPSQLDTSLALRNVQSTVRRHAVNALACCTYVMELRQ